MHRTENQRDAFLHSLPFILLEVLLEEVVEGDLTVDEIDGMLVGGEAVGSNHHRLDEDSFLDGVTQDIHFISD